jgi:hypothetical protein
MNLLRELSARASRLVLDPVLKLAGAAMCCILLSACSPEYDWREVKPEGSGLMAMMPARPASMTQPVNLNGISADMTLHGARVRDVAFTVGSARLPDALPERREHAVAAMRTAMVRNIGGTEQSSRPVSITVVNAAGVAQGTIAGVEVQANGKMRDTEVVLLARFAADGDRAWQAVVLGPRPDREQAALFLESLRVMRP